MRRLRLLFTVLLSACGAYDAGNGSSEGGASSVASLSSQPSPETFSAARGEATTLSVTVTRKTDAVKRLELTTEIGPVGLEVSPPSRTIDFEESAKGPVTTEFTVRVAADIDNAKPDFYLYGKALDERGRSLGSETLRLKYQWALP